MAEPIYLGDIVQSAEYRASDGEMTRRPGLREQGRDSPREESEWASRYLGGACCRQSLC